MFTLKELEFHMLIFCLTLETIVLKATQTRKLTFTVQDKQKQDKGTLEELIDISDISLHNIRGGQIKDYFFRSMYDYLKYEQLPTDHAMSKRIRMHYNDDYIHDKVLYHIWKNSRTGQVNNQIFVPI